jgi:glutamine cyclotransferase
MNKLLPFFLVIYLNAPLFGQTDSLQYYYQAAMDANEAEDYDTFIKYLVRANEIRPNHPTILKHLITGALQTNNIDLAFSALNSMVLMNAQFDLSDDAYSTLQNDSRFAGLVALSQKLNEPIENCEVTIKVDLGNLHPETLAYHYASNTYYFGGVHSREIVKMSEDGKVISVIDYSNDSSIMAVMGIDIDRKKNILWACTAALPQMKDFSDSLEGTSSVIAFDLNTGKIIESIEIHEGNTFGDLIVNRRGSVYISDGQSNQIFTVSEGVIELFVDLSDVVLNLQGLTFNNDESYMYVADYVTGIYRVNVTTGKVVKVTLPDDIPTKGIDGLYWNNGNLIALQNGTNPKRVIQLMLDAGNVLESIIIAQALEVLDEPTQGLIRDNEFLFIANSPWGAYSKDNNFLEEEAGETVVMKYEIE